MIRLVYLVKTIVERQPLVDAAAANQINELTKMLQKT